MEKLRVTTRKIIYSVFGLVTSVIFLDLVLGIFEASKDNYLVRLINVLSSFFVSPFSGTVSVNSLNILLDDRFNPDYVIAMLAYMFGALVLGEFVTAFMYEKLRDVIQNFVDALFKLVSFLLFTRIGIDFFGSQVNSISPIIVQIIWYLTNWSTGLVPSVVFLGLLINLSSALWLLIIVVIDSQFEKILDAFFNAINLGDPKINVVKPIIKITRKIVYLVNPGRVINIKLPGRRKEIVIINKPETYNSKTFKKVNQEFISNND
ncbi:hypothetical protein D6810_01890 [Candidatus Dojkabacteria bacterium]|uniref:Uncharacterized protein n=1 Tax=Candidatus Dojkabacteria bacterium TaxID=2099670 RepID=A0A3M0YYP7_9BACT|nr:MAG: hypothetical protein D6810_01890 [Candidatus Dojkabacteria bacterium]